MKIDRLLGITIYLLNHGNVNAKILAERFEVSVRTIGRDMDSLNLAGIPILTTYGANGGYEILDSFKWNRQLVDSGNYTYILTALQGLNTAWHSEKLKETLDKMVHTSADKEIVQKLFLDFSILHEGNQIDDYLKIIELAMDNKQCIAFNYTNANQYTSPKVIEPIALTYKWYAWYLLGYNHKHHDYRLYKVIRMRELATTKQPFTVTHESAVILLERQEKDDTNEYIDIRLKCKSEVKVQVEEYLQGDVVSVESDYFIMALRVPEYERMWFSMLLGFGKDIEVIEPFSLKERLMIKAKEIVEMYQ